MKGQPQAYSERFCAAIAGYLHEIRSFATVSRSDATLEDLYHTYGEERVQVELERVRYGSGRTTYCGDYADENQPPRAHRIYDIATGKCIGQLQTVDEEAVKAAPGIQEWSR